MTPMELAPQADPATDTSAHPVDISPATVLHQLARHCPDRVALRFEDGQLTYAELVDEAGRMAGVLAARGIVRGDRVGYLGLNSPAFLVTFLATCWLGAVFVPLNFRLTAKEVAEAFADCTPKAVVAEPDFIPAAEAASPVGAVQFLVGATDSAPGDPVRSWERLDDFLARTAAPGDPVPRHEPDLAMLAYTSGTTGRAKGVMLTHGNLWWNSLNLDLMVDAGPGDVSLVVAPLFHTAPFGCYTLRGLLRGGTIVLRRAFDPALTLAELVELRVTTFFAVPAMFAAIARQPGFADTDLSGLRSAVTAGAPAPPPLIASYRERGLALQQAYGLTETLFATCVPADRVSGKIASVGVPMPYTRVRVVDPATGQPVEEPDTPGEICLRGPTVTPGYWRNPAATSAARDSGGWFRTGDIGQLDTDGFVSIVDRRKDMIIVNGDNVFPAEVERALDDLPGVTELAVVGAPDDTTGECVVAVLVCAPDAAPPHLVDVRQYAGRHLAWYKLPSRVEYRDGLPRNAMGKVDKVTLRAEVATTVTVATPRPADGAVPGAPDEPVTGDGQAADGADATVTADPEVQRGWRTRLVGLSPRRRERHLLDLVIGHVAQMTGLTPDSVSDDHKLLDLGLGSLAALELRTRLGEATGLPLPSTVLFDRPTVGALAGYLHGLLWTDAQDGDETTGRISAALAELHAAVRADLNAGQRSGLLRQMQELLDSLRTADADAAVSPAPPVLDEASDEELFAIIDHQIGRA